MSKKPLILGIESSCDETAASIISENDKGIPIILSNIVSSQIDIHKEFGGVVPELAARSHIEKIDWIVKKAIDDSGVKINEIDAVKGPDKFLPHLLGHEGSGIVEGVGKGVSRVKVGDKVVLHWRPSQGVQSVTASYIWKGKKVNSGWVTTFNEKTIVSENRVTPIPKDFDLRIAALFGCAVTSAFGAVNNDANLKIGQSVLIFGIGGMGLNIAYAASLVSAYPIIGVDLHKEKIELGKKHGLTHGLIADSNELENQIKKILNNKSPEVVFETTGNSKVMEKAYDITPSDGKTVFVGVPNNKISIYS